MLPQIREYLRSEIPAKGSKAILYTVFYILPRCPLVNRAKLIGNAYLEQYGWECWWPKAACTLILTCSLLSSTASVVLLAPGFAAFQNCFWAEYRFMGHSLNRQSIKTDETERLLQPFGIIWGFAANIVQIFQQQGKVYKQIPESSWSDKCFFGQQECCPMNDKN